MSGFTEAATCRGGDIDESGIDRTLIRQLMALSPTERIRRLEDFVDGVLRIREANEESAVRRDPRASD